MKRLAERHKRRGYRTITALLKQEGWKVNKKRIQRLWRKEGMQITKRRKRKRVYRKGTGMPQKALYPNHVWCWDILFDQLENGTVIKILTIADEHTREVVEYRVDRRIRAADVQTTLKEAIERKGAPKFLRSDNGSEFIEKQLRSWLKDNGVRTIYIDPGCPWQNPFAESFNSTFRDECLNGEVFVSLLEARIIISRFMNYYNTRRPHSSLGYLAPLPKCKKIKRHRTYPRRTATRDTHSQRAGRLAVDISSLKTKRREKMPAVL